jgi:hypothetical protein
MITSARIVLDITVAHMVVNKYAKEFDSELLNPSSIPAMADECLFLFLALSSNHPCYIEAAKARTPCVYTQERLGMCNFSANGSRIGIGKEAEKGEHESESQDIRLSDLTPPLINTSNNYAIHAVPGIYGMLSSLRGLVSYTSPVCSLNTTPRREKNENNKTDEEKEEKNKNVTEGYSSKPSTHAPSTPYSNPHKRQCLPLHSDHALNSNSNKSPSFSTDSGDQCTDCSQQSAVDRDREGAKIIAVSVNNSPLTAKALSLRQQSFSLRKRPRAEPAFFD